MKREVERERELPAFSLSIGELEALWARLAALFDDPADIYSSIDVRLPGEQIEFASLEELKQYAALPPRITSFYIRLRKGERRVSIRSGKYWATTNAKVSASSETEAWCAGAIETVYSFVQSHKVWYHWFLSAPVGWALVLVGNAPWLASAFMPKGSKIEMPIVIGWAGIVATLLILYFAKERVLPAGIIQVADRDGFIQKHVAELSLGIAVISAILTIVGWFVAK
ncbi:MAG: hypothetical protein B7Y41_02295 [Hydrogenophilales bacterium 28-61-23]|nr:MAG: hypothetical protein B7Y41_02295 [Hydrogenophilales bacterium 28-61-23]